MKEPNILIIIVIAVIIGFTIIMVTNDMLVNAMKVSSSFEDESETSPEDELEEELEARLEECMKHDNFDDCQNAECKWCSECNEDLDSTSKQVNQWGEDRCVIPEMSCRYGCKMGECDAECSDGGSPTQCPMALERCHPTRCECALV